MDHRNLNCIIKERQKRINLIRLLYQDNQLLIGGPLVLGKLSTLH